MERLSSTSSDLRILLSYLFLPPERGDVRAKLAGRWRDFAGPKSAKDDEEGPTSSEPAESEFNSLVDSIDERDGSLYFLHSRLPHVPWAYLPSGKYYGDVPVYPPGVVEEVWGDSEILSMQGFRRHLLQLQFADKLLGRLIARLEKSGVWDRALVVVLADHGVSFQPGVSRRSAVPENFPAILSVPVFIKAPGQSTGRMDARTAETIDIMPTIADILGRPLHWTFDGRSLLDSDRPARTDRKVLVFGEPFRVESYPRNLSLQSIIVRKLRLFGSGEDTDRIFKAGPFASYLGRSVEELPRGDPSPMRAEVDDSWAYESIDLDSDRTPAYVHGRIRGIPPDKPRRRLRLAIAVNGRVGAVTETFGRRGASAEFAALLPDKAFIPGKNHVQVLLVSSDAASFRLTSLSEIDHQWRIEESDAGTELVSENGKRVLVGQDGISGVLDRVVSDGSQIELFGWAADSSGVSPVRLILFINGRGRYFTSTRYQRDDVAEFFKRPDFASSGFRLVVPTEALSGSNSRLRLVGVSGNRAVEIRYPQDAQGLHFGGKSDAASQ
jgi:hypothetical protein